MDSKGCTRGLGLVSSYSKVLKNVFWGKIDFSASVSAEVQCHITYFDV